MNFPEELARPTKEAGATPPPNLTYRGGPLLKNVQVFTLFWGSAWGGPSMKSVIDEINKFFQFILTSSLVDQLAEYDRPNFKIGHGSFVGTTTISKPALKSSVSDKVIQHVLQQEIGTNKSIPQPNPDLLYFVYLPPGVAVVQGGGKSCQVFCGYHDNIGGQIFYAPMPYPGCPGCNGAASGLTVIEALTSTSSHELCEAITDPVPGQGWYDDYHGEIGDICSWRTKKVGIYAVQKEWSDSSKSCN